MEELDLYENFITEIADEAFLHCPNLDELELYDNHLTVINATMFKGMVYKSV